VPEFRHSARYVLGVVLAQPWLAKELRTPERLMGLRQKPSGAADQLDHICPIGGGPYQRTEFQS